MSILLNLVAFVVSMVLVHRVVTVGWFNAFQNVLTRRLLDKAIIPASEWSTVRLKAYLTPFVALWPLGIVLFIAWLIPGGLLWIRGSWGVMAALALGLAEFAVFALTATGRAVSYAAVYKEYADKFPKKLAAWQEKELAPFRKAHAEELEAESEEAGRTSTAAGTATFQGGVGDGPPQARLDFDILESHTDCETTEAAPFFRKGGRWSVLKCRTRAEPAATFWFAETSGPLSGDPPFAFGDSKMWADSPADGTNLCRAIVATFDPALTGCAVEPTPGVMTLSTAVFSRDTAPAPGGGFSGKGSWTATKWFTEDGSEFFLNWSASAKQGHFSEKDETYAEGICEAFGARFEGSDEDDDDLEDED